MRAGDLRDKVIFKREERVSDGMGGWETTEKIIATAWASVKVPASISILPIRDGNGRIALATLRQNPHFDTSYKGWKPHSFIHLRGNTRKFRYFL